MEKKVVIIGAGISGLSAGIYALDSGYDVDIYELHSIPGGECTGWTRKGTFIDGCAHWIVGTNKKSNLYPLWIHTGAFDEDTKVYPTEYFTKYDINGEVVTIYSDREKLREELLRVAPEDEKEINKLVKDIGTYGRCIIPAQYPVSYMGPVELLSFAFSYLPFIFLYLKCKNLSMVDLISRYKSPILRELFSRTFTSSYNVNSFYYTLKALSENDGGVVEGGSLKIATNMAHRFTELGGKIHYKSEVEEIIVENKVATGIKLKDGTIINADYVIATSDMHHTLYNLLKDKYTPRSYRLSFENRKDYPLNCELLLAYKVKKDVSELPKMINFRVDPFNIDSETIITSISVRNHAFNKELYSVGNTLFTVGLEVTDKAYDYFKSLDKETYNKKKIEIGERVKEEIKKYYNFTDEDIELIDVATPLTYERYCHAYKGSYMSFIATKQSKWLMHKSTLKGVKNLYLAGQWLMPPGGLPIALFTGKYAVCRIIRKEHGYIGFRRRIRNS